MISSNKNHGGINIEIKLVVNNDCYMIGKKKVLKLRFFLKNSKIIPLPFVNYIAVNLWTSSLGKTEFISLASKSVIFEYFSLINLFAPIYLQALL